MNSAKLIHDDYEITFLKNQQTAVIVQVVLGSSGGGSGFWSGRKLFTFGRHWFRLKCRHGNTAVLGETIDLRRA